MEKYKIETWNRDRESQIKIAPLDAQGYDSRGATLAKALHGRWARGSGVFFITPARAKKWEVLFRAGFTAIKVNNNTDPVWRFVREGFTEKFPLHDAMKIARVLNGNPTIIEVD